MDGDGREKEGFPNDEAEDARNPDEVAAQTDLEELEAEEGGSSAPESFTHTHPAIPGRYR